MQAQETRTTFSANKGAGEDKGHFKNVGGLTKCFIHKTENKHTFGEIMIETYRGVVYPHHLDHMEHMNVQWYVAKFDAATWHFFSHLGITSTYIRNNNRGMAAVEQIIKYKEEALVGDLLVIKSRMLEMKAKSIRFIHLMFNSETHREIASCELVGVHIDRQSRKSCPFPEKIYEKGTRLILEGNS